MERNKEKRLGKSRADKKITGVCGGIAALPCNGASARL